MEKIEIVKSYWNAEGNKELNKTLSHFTEDARYIAPGLDLDGRDSIEKFYGEAWGGFQSLEVRPTHWLESGDEIAVQYDCSFIRLSGEERLIKGFNLFRIANDLICEIHCYFNPADF